MHDSLESWSAALVGKTLAGRYLVTDVLGAGGVGAVFGAKHIAVGRRVALKVLHPELQAHGSMVERFHREARAAAACAREGVVDVLDLDRDPACGPFLVMEHLEGETLSARLRARAPLSIEETLVVVRALLATLAAVHARGIVHRDLKPANVMLARTPEGREVVKVLDFGLARETSTSGRMAITMPGSVLGTPRFMAPEQAAGHPPVDARADLYAIGAILYCCLGARPPYADVPPEEALHAVLLRPPMPLDRLRPDLHPAILDVVRRAMARDRDERFSDAESLRTALELAFVGFDDASTLVDPSDERAVLSPIPTTPAPAAAHPAVWAATEPASAQAPAGPAPGGLASTRSYPAPPLQRAHELPTTAARSNPLPRSAVTPQAAPGTNNLGRPASAQPPMAAGIPAVGVSARSRSGWCLPVALGLAVIVGLPAFLVARSAARGCASDDSASVATPASPALSQGEAAGRVTIRSVTFGRAVSERGTIDQPVTVFTSDDTGVRTSIELDGRPSHGTLEARFIPEWQTDPLASVSFDLSRPDEAVVPAGEHTRVTAGFTMNRGTPLYISAYQLELRHDGVVVGSYPFRVAPPAGALASRILHVVLAKGTDADGRATEPTTAFGPADTPNIVGVGDFGQGSWIEARWMTNGVVHREASREVRFAHNAPSEPFSFRFRPSEGWPQGNHEVVLLLNGPVVDRYAFTVAPPP